MERYDLFKKLPDGSPYRVGCAKDLEEAESKIRQLILSYPAGEFLIRDSLTGETITVPNLPE